jgi:hypothetical protein
VYIFILNVSLYYFIQILNCYTFPIVIVVVVIFFFTIIIGIAVTFIQPSSRKGNTRAWANVSAVLQRYHPTFQLESEPYH